MHADFFAAGVEEPDLRAKALGLRLTAPLRINNDESRQARNFIDLLGNRNAFFNVLELHLA